MYIGQQNVNLISHQCFNQRKTNQGYTKFFLKQSPFRTLFTGSKWVNEKETVHVMRKFLRKAAYNCVKSFSFTKQDQPRISFKGTYFRRKIGNREDVKEMLFMKREMYSPNNINANLHTHENTFMYIEDTKVLWALNAASFKKRPHCWQHILC